MTLAISILRLHADRMEQEGNYRGSVDCLRIFNRTNTKYKSSTLLPGKTQQRAILTLRQYCNTPNVEDDIDKAATEFVLKCNSFSMRLLKEGSADDSLEMLHRSQVVLNATPPLFTSDNARRALIGVTLNNLGCYYKELRKLGQASKYLVQAIALEKELGSTTLPTTYLNYCAVLSLMGKHRDAVKYAKCAIHAINYKSKSMALSNSELNREAIETSEQLALASASAIDAPNKHAGEGEGSIEGSAQAVEEGVTGTDGDIELAAVAYYNLATEHEHLRQLDEASSAYTRALQLLSLQDPSNEAFISKIEEALEVVSEVISKRRVKAPSLSSAQAAKTWRIGMKRPTKRTLVEPKAKPCNNTTTVMAPCNNTERKAPSIPRRGSYGRPDIRDSLLGAKTSDGQSTLTPLETALSLIVERQPISRLWEV